MAANRRTLTVDRSQRGHFGPAWRYELALRLPPRVPPRVAQSYDEHVRDLRMYLTLKAEGDLARADQRFPAIAAADELNQNSDLTATIKLMVVGNLPVDEIAERTGVPAAVLEVWEGLFFDVRDLREATSWLSVHVIRKERRGGDPVLAGRLQCAACLGPVGVRAVLAAEEGLPIDEADRLFQQKLRLQVKMNEAVDMPLTSEKELVKFLNSSTWMQVELKKIELGTRKLEQKCAQARDRHELSKLRLELERERLAARTAEREGRVGHHRRRDVARAVVDPLRAPISAANPLAARAATSLLSQLKWGTIDSADIDTTDTTTTILSFTGGSRRADRTVPSQGEGGNAASTSPDLLGPKDRLKSA